jgi:hypothetical protein
MSRTRYRQANRIPDTAPNRNQELIDQLQVAAPLADRLNATLVELAHDAAALRAAIARAIAALKPGANGGAK